MNSKGEATIFHFHGDLFSLLRGRWRRSKSVNIRLGRRTSVKDAVESFGLPHTEVGAVMLRGEEVDFSSIVEEGSVFDIFPVPVPWQVTEPTLLRPVSLPYVSFVVDVNVGRLARYLRAAGVDTLYDPKWKDEFIADMMHREKRILLTRDLQLLQRKQIVYGRYVRETDPAKQLHEILNLFALEGELKPFTRCLECNSLLQRIDKKDVLHRLEPLTRKYHTCFSHCIRCDKIYWPGSHIDGMARLLDDHPDFRSGEQ